MMTTEEYATLAATRYVEEWEKIRSLVGNDDDAMYATRNLTWRANQMQRVWAKINVTVTPVPGEWWGRSFYRYALAILDK